MTLFLDNNRIIFPREGRTNNKQLYVANLVSSLEAGLTKVYDAKLRSLRVFIY